MATAVLTVLLCGALVLALPRSKPLADPPRSFLPPAVPSAANPPRQASAPPPTEQPPLREEERTAPPAKEEKPAQPEPLLPAPAVRVVKRRVQRTEDELIRQVEQASAVGLDRTPARAESKAAIALAKQAQKAKRPKKDVTLALLDGRANLAGLPIRRGSSCRLAPPAAAHFDDCANILRRISPTSVLLDRSSPKYDLNGGVWLKPETVPVLMQMLMAEPVPVREALAEHLALVAGPQATQALAQLALFDLHPAVRERAISALAKRPGGDYEETLLKGFEHPWPAVADHAAEALVALQRKDTVGRLERLLASPDPRAPYRKPGVSGTFVREMVRVNHLHNCLLCHPPSLSSRDKLRGLVPELHLAVDPSSAAYYAPAPGRTFVRADVTYLKQNFSTLLKVANPGKWPERQRFDFFVRERLATPRDHQESIAHKAAGPTEQQQAAYFAIQGLMGENAGRAFADLKQFLLSQAAHAKGG